MGSGDFSGAVVSTDGVVVPSPDGIVDPLPDGAVVVGVGALAVDDKSIADDTSDEISGISTQLIAGTTLVVIASDALP